MSLYRILELRENATQEEIKRQYRKQSLKYHPDKNIKDHEKYYKIYFNIITTAYNILKDGRLKYRYDT